MPGEVFPADGRGPEKVSKSRALKTIALEPTGQVGRFELIEDPRFVQKLTGIDPHRDALAAFAEAYRRLDVDVTFPHTLPLSIDRADQSWGIGSSKPVVDAPFTSSRDVVSYDPGDWFRSGRLSAGQPMDPASPGLVDDLAERFYGSLQRRQEAVGDSMLLPGTWGYTLFHFLTNTFGFEKACIAAMDLPKDFKGLLERFAEVSRAVIEAWCMLPTELFISHDDLAMQKGLIFPPDWYRENIFPWYRELWRPLKEKGIPILFWSDGDYSAVLDDVMACGADGFVLEPMMDLEEAVRRYGGKKFIVGNANSTILTLADPEAVRAEVSRCISSGGECPGYFLCATGSITHTMPLENIEAYFAAVTALGSGGGQ